MHHSRRHFLILLAALSGCTTCSYQPGQPLADPTLTHQLQQSWMPNRPPHFRALYRALLKTGSAEYPFTIYLIRHDAASCQILALDDLGTTLFEVLSPADAPGKILRNNRGLPPKLLQQGLARDAVILCLSSPPLQSTLVEHPSTSQRGLLLGPPSPSSARIYEYLYSRSTLPAAYIEATSSSHCLYRADFNWPAASLSPGPLPTLVTITNTDLGYHLLLELHEFHEVSP